MQIQITGFHELSTLRLLTLVHSFIRKFEGARKRADPTHKTGVNGKRRLKSHVLRVFFPLCITRSHAHTYTFCDFVLSTIFGDLGLLFYEIFIVKEHIRAFFFSHFVNLISSYETAQNAAI